jgi:hypothetical protein
MSCPCHYNPGRELWYPLTRSVGRFMASLDVLENRKISSLPGFKLQVAQPVA